MKLRIIHLLFCNILCISSGVSGYSTAELKISTSTSGDYNISVNGEQFLQSAPTFFNFGGETYSGERLKLNRTFGGNDEDELGKYQYEAYAYVFPTQEETTATITTDIRIYGDKPWVTFAVQYMDGAEGTRSKDCKMVSPFSYTCFDETIAGFPSFFVKDISSVLGFLNYGGTMVGDTGKKLNRFGSGSVEMADGMNGGPLVLFNEKGSSLVISPIDHFMSMSMWHNTGRDTPGTVSWGIMGGVKSVPPQFTHRTVIVAGNGINEAMRELGSVFRTLYKSESEMRKTNQENDLTVNYLGYWTDNGAYYYYHTEEGETYEETLEDVRTYSNMQNIPFRYLQLDSWWYFKGARDAVKNWTARPDIFSKGIGSTDNVYAKQNGGEYNFIMEKLSSLPDDQKFWMDLLTTAKEDWGLILYEQDWLNVQTLELAALQQNLTLGETWLTQMGNAASQLGLTIQYCMSLPRHALQSLTIPSVTQARVSGDYHPGNEQWRIGISTMLASAIGLSPFKDTFWTTKTQPGNPRYLTSDEPNHRLETVVAVLSNGPIGPGDKNNHTDVEFLKRCCSADGTILKATRPATAIDRQVIKLALPEADGPTGEVWTTYTTIHSPSTFVNRTFGIIFAADLTEPYSLKWEDTGLPDSLKNSIIFPLDHPEQWKMFGESFTLTNCTKTDFCLYYLTTEEPGMNGTSMAILGELDKLIPMSPQRVTDIRHAEIDISVKVRGTPGESVTISFLVGKASITHNTCKIGEEGTAEIMAYTCFK